MRARKFPEGLVSLRKAERLEPRDRSARAALLSGLVSLRPRFNAYRLACR